MQSDTVAGFRLSPQQECAWPLLEGSCGLPYRMQCAIRLQGRLDAECLRRAIRQVVERHEILRTVYLRLPGLRTPFQVINDDAGFAWRTLALCDLTEATQEAEVERAFAFEKERVFDLQRGPVLHALLIALAPEHAVLIVSMPAMCADAWSLKNLVEEIGRCYAAQDENQGPSEEPLRYIQFSEWQNELLATEDANTAAGREHWHNLDLSDVGCVNLPFEKEPSDASRFDPQSVPLDIGPDLVAKIDASTARDNSSTALFLLACWQALLWRLTGSSFAVGTLFHGREYEELRGALGLFARRLPLPCRVDENFRFAEVLHKTQELTHTWSEWQDYFALEFQNGKRIDLPIAFDFEEWASPYSLPELSLSVWKQYTCLDHFKVKLVCARQDGKLRADFHYDASRLERQNIESLARHFGRLLHSATENPQARISELEMLTEDERRQLLVEWNSTAAEYPRQSLVHQLFEIQAERVPGSPALVFQDQKLTYAELNQRANRLAHYLRRACVRPTQLVGLCAERSLDLIVGLLAILKAGAAYVPVNPDNPKSRLKQQLGQTVALLTQEKWLERLPAIPETILCLDRDRQHWANEPSSNPEPLVSPEDLAYVIYTSGSTGVPKGVAIHHRSLVNYSLFICRKLQLENFSEGLHFATLSTIAADLGNTCIFPALISGGCLHVISYDLATDPGRFGRYTAEKGIDVLKIVPSHLKALLSSPEPRAVLPRRFLILGGETLSAELVERVRELEGTCQILNHYGPTETTVGSLTLNVSEYADCWKTTSVPIGRPVANTQIYILDRNLQPVPVGIAGELYIGGAGVSQGYLGAPDLTAERFVVDPFRGSSEGKLYRTGDLARYLPDGNVEFLGRQDDQVKVRGFRIELGEIEAALCSHPGVRDCAVLARESPISEKRLVAYVVLERGSALTSEQLRLHLADRLPDYMLPAAFIRLEKLPLTANGKLDRAALPELEEVRPELQTAYVVPRNPIEEVVAGMWAELLSLPQIGVHDDLFKLGAHSLLATQVVARVRRAFNVEVPLRSFFEIPTVAGMAQEIEAALQAGHGIAVPPLVKVPRNGDIPVTFAQRRLWFLDQLEPGNTSYNATQAIRMKGALNIEVLQNSLNTIVRRHEALRVQFITVHGEPMQQIASELLLSLPVLDLTTLPEDQRETEAQRLATEESRRFMDLCRGPLVRTMLLRLDQEDHVLVLSLHHIISDGWSGGILVRELSSLYDACSAGKPSPLPELPIQYPDYAVWQRAWLQGEELERQVSYWKQQLAGAPATLELPTDRPRPAIQTFRGAKQVQLFPTELAAGLRLLSHKEGASLFMTLLAAFQVLLFRYSGQESIVVGSPIANRHRAETEGLIGFFANTLALRTDLSGNPSFRELLGRVREIALGAYAHQDMPFEKLVEELHPERSLSHNPVFQVLFALQNAPRQRLELRNLKLQPLPLESGTAKFDLSLYMTEKADGLSARLEYNTDLFDETTIVRLLGHFRMLLENIVADPGRRLSEFGLLTEAEQRQLLIDWNNTEQDYPAQSCLHELFEGHAEKTPNTVAAVFEDHELTYRDLNARANQLAHFLRKRGVEPGQRVGIYVERSLEMIVGLLGILKSGAAYVPLDPAYPSERIESMLRDADISVLLTQQALVTQLPPQDAELICLDLHWERIAQENVNNPSRGASPGDLAYVIFTSGSTGRPKGVQIPHRAVVNLLSFMQRELLPGEGDTFPALASFAFDMCIPELYLPLISGSRLVIAPAQVAGNGEELWKLMQQSGATTLHATPTTWRLVLDAGFEARGIRMLCGAEPLPRDLCDRLLEAGPRLYNFYGPTETTVWSAFHLFRSKDEPICIGRPIANTQIYIVDRNLQPVPIGVPGELLIGGAGIAHGYLNRPELTAEKFVPNPFGEPGSRLYKTGDLARYLPDGRIEFLGRVDNQVKLRGFRIELGEIESVLASHPTVEEAVAIVREDHPGDKRLVAYVIAVSGHTPHAPDLRDYVKDKLPDYMVPSAFVVLDKMPLTPNGKVNRRGMPPPEQSACAAQEGSATLNPIEEVVSGIWAEVLRVERIGINDDFFALGGHSLLATLVISRMREAFQLDIPLRSIFEASTVKAFAERIDDAHRTKGGVEVRRLAPASRELSLPLSFAQQRLWFLDKLQPNSPFYNIRWSVRLSGRLNLAALESSLAEVARRHEALRTSFAPADDEPVQVILPRVDIKLPVTDLSHLAPEQREAEARRQAIAEAQQPFDLGRAPLFRVRLLRLGTDDHVLVVTMHHIISDRWSMGVLSRELGALYAHYSAGKPLSLPPLPIQYADFAVWQRQYLEGSVLANQLEYWRTQLEGVPPLLQLPTDRPRPELQTYEGSVCSIKLPHALMQELLALSRREATTLFMTMLAAFQVLLARYSGQEDLVIGTDLANRTHVETEGLIGFFVNLVPLRLRLQGDPSFRELLQQVREVALGAYAHQDMPFDKLVEDLRLERSAAYNPLVQVLFVQQNTPRSPLDLPDVKVSQFDLGVNNSKFDLAVFMVEGEHELSGYWVYKTDLFDAATIAHMASDYESLLSRIVADSSLRLGSLSEMLAQAERQRRAAGEQAFQEASLRKLKAIKRKTGA